MDIINSPKSKQLELKKEENKYFNFRCPKCKQKKVKRIAYGLPAGPDSFAPNEIIGGCVIEHDAPKWHCENCNHEWGVADDY